MLSFYKLVDNKLVFIARVKHEASAQRIIREWHDLGTDSTTLIAFTNPTLENTDGFVAHWTRVPFVVSDEQVNEVVALMGESAHTIAA